MKSVLLVILTIFGALSLSCGNGDIGDREATPTAVDPTSTIQQAGEPAETATDAAGPPTSTSPAPPTAPTHDPVDLLGLCFDETALPDTTNLPGSFGDDTSGDGIEVTNEMAASSTLNPVATEQQLADWGRLTGIYRSWAFQTDTPGPTKKESLSLPTATPDARATQEERERRSVPIVAVNCEVEHYLTAAGAKRAFPYRVETHMTTLPLAPELVVRIEDLPLEEFVDDALAMLVRHEYLGQPNLRIFKGAVRLGNVVGHVSVHGPRCNVPDGLSCEEVDATLADEGQRLLRLLRERIEVEAKSRGPGELLPESTSVPTPAAQERHSINPDVPKSVYHTLPSLYEARLTAGVPLVEARLRAGNSQLFEHTATDELVTGFSGLYNGDGTSLVIELAVFETAGGAEAGFEGIDIADLAGHTRAVEEIDTEGVGNAAKGWLWRAAPESSEFIAVAVARVERIVVGVTVSGRDPQRLASVVQALLELEADAIEIREITQ